MKGAKVGDGALTWRERPANVRDMQLRDEDLTGHGVEFEDEALHPFPMGFEACNESLFFDWIQADGGRAGHCRIGLHPGLGRLWFWLYLYDGSSWLCIDEPCLTLDKLETDGPWAWTSKSLSFHRTVDSPLRQNTLKVRGDASVVGDPSKPSVAVAVDLVFHAAGPAHGMAGRSVPWTDGTTYEAARYEQPCNVTGTIDSGEGAVTFEGFGERDHSWGPRLWAMQWFFLVVAADALRVQATEVVIGGSMRVCVGYVQDEQMRGVTDAEFDLEFEADTEVQKPCAGSVAIKTEGGTVLRGAIRPVTGTALDDSHCLPEGERSLYRRTLVQFTPEGSEESFMGWLETHRMVAAS